MAWSPNKTSRPSRPPETRPTSRRWLAAKRNGREAASRRRRRRRRAGARSRPGRRLGRRASPPGALLLAPTLVLPLSSERLGGPREDDRPGRAARHRRAGLSLRPAMRKSVTRAGRSDVVQPRRLAGGSREGQDRAYRDRRRERDGKCRPVSVRKSRGREAEDRDLGDESGRIMHPPRGFGRHEQPQLPAVASGAPMPNTHCTAPLEVRDPHGAMAASAQSSSRKRTPSLTARTAESVAAAEPRWDTGKPEPCSAAPLRDRGDERL
jgi:hypothetical protein